MLAGHRVVLIAPDYIENGDDDKDIIRIKSRKVMFDEEDRLMRASDIKSLAPELQQVNFDLIHIQTPFVAHYMGYYLAKTLGIPCIETYHTFFEEYLYNYIPVIPKTWLRYLARKFTLKQCNNVDHVIVPSTAMQEVLSEYGVLTETSIIPTGIECDQLRDGNGTIFRITHGIGLKRPVLIHVGRVAHEKNIDFLLRMLTHVWQENPEVLLLIAGEGPAEKKLKRCVDNLGLNKNVLFVGYQKRGSELNDCYSCGDIFVFSSRTETQGLVLLEAMALGVPVVSTAVMGTLDVLHECDGALVAEEDEHKFATKVNKLLTNEILRKRLATAAPHHARQWSADRQANRLLDLYRRISQNPPTPSIEKADLHKQKKMTNQS